MIRLRRDQCDGPTCTLLIRNGRVPPPGIGFVAADEAVATRLGVQGVIVVRTVPGSYLSFWLGTTTLVPAGMWGRPSGLSSRVSVMIATYLPSSTSKLSP